MRLLEKMKALFRREKPEKEQENKDKSTASAVRIKKTCKACGKTFSVDPSWEYIPNYCKDCKKRFIQEKEEKQRTGAPRKIRRKCKACGNFFSFPNTLEHYPNYCPNCRKRHQAEMKAKYSRKNQAQAAETMIQHGIGGES